MARLIVDDGIKPRRFQLKNGKITIGSGQASKLRLEDSQLAELHAELEYNGEEATLRLSRGVRPADAAGKSVSGEWTMIHGQTVDLGGVTLKIEYEGAEAESLVQRRSKQGKAKATAARATKSGASAKRSSAGRARAGQPSGNTVRQGDPEGGGIQRQRRTVKKGVPTWVVLLGGAVLLFVGYTKFKSYADSVDAHGFVPQASYNRIQDALNVGNFALIEAEFEKIEARPDVPLNWQTKFAECRKVYEAVIADRENSVDNQRGTVYLDSKIKGFESKRLVRDKPLHKVRIFLMRLKYFQERWPSHPEMAWVRRTEDRYQQIDDLNEAPDFEDLCYESEVFTWEKDFKNSLKLLYDYKDSASAQERSTLDDLITQRETEAKEHYDDRLLQAKHEWEKDDAQSQAKAVERLVQLVTKMGDEAMVAESARRLLLIPDIDSRWGGYKRDRPDTYTELMANASIRAHLKAIGRE
ncbi:MAG: hypothetical protein ACI841_000224 [Planctomycetota bacterium]|jgi:hypothetical protein